jgi:V8-like Glu-specific endopeptidase
MRFNIQFYFILIYSFNFLFLNECVQAQDTLVSMKVENTSDIPFSVVCQLEVQRKSIKTLWLWKSKHQSTGFFITPNTIMTNAHNVYSNFFTRVTDININPGRNLDFIALDPKTIVGRKQVKNTVKIPKEYSFYQVSSRRVNHDYAIIQLANYSTFNNIAFELAKVDSLVSVNDNVIILGYPGETKSGKEQYLAEGKLTSINDKTIEYNISTETGNSGSPVYVFSNGIYYVIGVHAFPNQATKINREVIEKIKAWTTHSTNPNY